MNLQFNKNKSFIKILNKVSEEIIITLKQI